MSTECGVILRRPLSAGRRGGRLACVTSCSTLALLLASTSAAAEERAASGSQAASGALEEVVVTAQFRSQNVQNTPLAITAVTSGMMEARSQTSIADVANRAPSVTFATAGNGLGGSQSVAINIRGVGQADFNLALEPGVGVYIDDVYYGTMYGSTFNLLDLDRVEILRGPQGTLSGKNSEGGSLRLFSKVPDGRGGGYVEATAGDYNRRGIRGSGEFTLVQDQLFLRVTGLAEKQDGFVTRYDYQCYTGKPADQLNNIPSLAGGGPQSCKLGAEGGKDVTAVRGILRWVPTENIEDTVTYDSMVDRSDPPPMVLRYQGTWHGPGFNLLSTPAVPNLASNFVTPSGQYYDFATFTGLAGTANQYGLQAVDTVNAWGLSNSLDVKFGAAMSVKSITALRKSKISSVSDGDASPFSRNMNLWAVDYKQFTQELRLNGSYEKLLDWTIGGFYFKSNAIQGGRISLDGAGDNLIPFFVTTDFLFNDPVDVESKSGFAHVELRPMDKVILTGGLRYTDDYKRYGFTRTFAQGYAPGPIDQSIAGTNGAAGVFSGSRWDYRLTAAYQLSSDMNLYAQWATGFKGGGINPRPYYLLQVQPFKPESVDSYEVGFKSQLFDHTVRLNAALFYNKYSDIQLVLYNCPKFVPAGAPQNCAMPSNVGNATIKGVEFEVEAHPVGNLVVDASASYVDFKYDDADTADTGVRLTDKPPYTPKTKFSVGAQYEFGLPNNGSITPRLDYNYQSDSSSYATNYPNGDVPAFGIANARLTYRDPTDAWSVSAEVTNLFNKYYWVNTLDFSPPQSNPPSYNFTSVQLAAPRMMALTIKRKF